MVIDVYLSGGSSPLTRGKRFGEDLGGFGGGLIPAHAGKTLLGEARVVEWEAHPRSRGENTTAPRSHRAASGSSPLTRGKPTWQLFLAQASGLIPAHAGKTRLMSAGMTQARAHPRSRGENDTLGATGFRLTGSSPLTRGKPSVRVR